MKNSSKEKSWPSILLAAPTWVGHDHCIRLWISHVRAIIRDYPGDCSWLIVDNSNDPDHANFLKGLAPEATVMWLKPKLKFRETHVLCLNKIRSHFLDDNFDYLLSQETDVLPPTHALKKLVRTSIENNYQILGGTYLIKTKQYFGPCTQIWRRTGQLLDLVLPNKQELEQILNVGGIQQVAGCGLGCTLIHRSIFETVEFTVDPTDQVSADSTFYRDVFLAGGQVWCDLSVKGLHFKPVANCNLTTYR